MRDVGCTLPGGRGLELEPDCVPVYRCVSVRDGTAPGAWKGRLREGRAECAALRRSAGEELGNWGLRCRGGRRPGVSLFCIGVGRAAAGYGLRGVYFRPLPHPPASTPQLFLCCALTLRHPLPTPLGSSPTCLVPPGRPLQGSAASGALTSGCPARLPSSAAPHTLGTPGELLTTCLPALPGRVPPCSGSLHWPG